MAWAAENPSRSSGRERSTVALLASGRELHPPLLCVARQVATLMSFTRNGLLLFFVSIARGVGGVQCNANDRSALAESAGQCVQSALEYPCTVPPPRTPLASHQDTGRVWRPGNVRPGSKRGSNRGLGLEGS